MLAVSGCPKAVDKPSDLIHIGKVERHVGADRKPDAVRGQWNLADEIEDRGAGSLAAGQAMIQSDLKHVELRKVRVRPVINVPSIPDADGGMRLDRCPL
jgi:hypothetical protein